MQSHIQILGLLVFVHSKHGHLHCNISLQMHKYDINVYNFFRFLVWFEYSFLSLLVLTSKIEKCLKQNRAFLHIVINHYIKC